MKNSPLIFLIGNKPFSRDLNANLCKMCLIMFNVLLVRWPRTLGCPSSWTALSSDRRLRGVLKTWDSHQRTGAGCCLLQVRGGCEDPQSYGMCWTRIIFVSLLAFCSGLYFSLVSHCCVSFCFLHFNFVLFFNTIFKGYTAFTVITKYWLCSPCCTVHPCSLSYTQ